MREAFPPRLLVLRTGPLGPIDPRIEEKNCRLTDRTIVLKLPPSEDRFERERDHFDPS